MTDREPMFKIIPWRVKFFKNQYERLLTIIEILKELDYDLEVDYEKDINNNENIVFWLMYSPESKSEMFNQLIEDE